MSLEDKLIKVRQSLISLKEAGNFVTLSEWEQQRNLQNVAAITCTDQTYIVWKLTFERMDLLSELNSVNRCPGFPALIGKYENEVNFVA